MPILGEGEELVLEELKGLPITSSVHRQFLPWYMFVCARVVCHCVFLLVPSDLSGVGVSSYLS